MKILNLVGVAIGLGAIAIGSVWMIISYISQKASCGHSLYPCMTVTPTLSTLSIFVGVALLVVFGIRELIT